MLSFDDKGNVSFKSGADLKPAELAFVALAESKTAECASLRMANTLRLARQLPPVVNGEIETPAFELAKIAFRSLAVTDGAFYNAFGMVAALDFVETNKLTHISPFVAKETMGSLRAWGVLTKDDSKPLALTVKSDSDERAKKLVRVLKDTKNPARVNSIRDVIAELKGKPAKKAKAPVTDTPPEGEKAPAVTYTPETLNAELISVRGQWDKTVSASDVATVRKVCSQSVIELAKLAGFSCVPMPK